MLLLLSGRVIVRAAAHCPHVLAARQLEGGHNLWPHGLLEETQGPILAVARGGDKLDVWIRGRGRELLGEERRLSHCHLATGPDVLQRVAHLEAVRGDLGGCCLLAPVHFKLVELRVEPISLDVQSFPLGRRLPLPPHPQLAELSAGELQQEGVAQPRAEEEETGSGKRNTCGENRGGGFV